MATRQSLESDLKAAWDETADSLADESSGPASLETPQTLSVVDDGQADNDNPNSDEEKEQVGLFAELEDTDATDEGNNLDDGDSNSFVVNGETVSFQELKDGYLRQSDYTRKTQELAEMRDEYEKAITLYEAIQEKPVETIRSLAARAGVSLSGYGGRQSASTDSVDIESIVNQKVQEALQSDPRLQNVAEREAQAAVDAAFEQIEEDFNVKLTEDDKRVVLEKASEMNVQNADQLRLVFAGLLQEVQLRKARKNQLSSVSPVSGRRSDESDDLPKVSAKEYDDFWEAARDSAKELGLTLT